MRNRPRKETRLRRHTGSGRGRSDFRSAAKSPDLRGAVPVEISGSQLLGKSAENATKIFKIRLFLLIVLIKKKRSRLLFWNSLTLSVCGVVEGLRGGGYYLRGGVTTKISSATYRSTPAFTLCDTEKGLPPGIATFQSDIYRFDNAA